MKEYIDLVNRVLKKGVFKNDRTGTGCYSIHGEMIKFDLTKGFPILTTKKMGIKNIAAELIWFLSGSTNINDLKELGCNIWDEWANENGDLGPIYGKQWRDFNGVDQIKELIKSLITNPDSRRHLVTAWNPEVLPVNILTTQLHYTDRLYLTGFNEEQITDIKKTYGLVTLNNVINTSNVINIDKYSIAIKRLHIYLDKLGIQRYSNIREVSTKENVELGNAALPACHVLFQMHTVMMDLDSRFEWIKENCESELVEELGIVMFDDNENITDEMVDETFDLYHIPKYELKCQMYQRSADVALGVPYNIASYALLTHLISKEVNMVPTELIWMGGDVHIYENHLEKLTEQIEREPKSLPKLVLGEDTTLFEVTLSDISLDGYECHDPVGYDVSI